MKPSRLRLLSTGEAALRLSVTPDTVLKWIKQGRIPAQRTAGGHHRIDAGEIERLKTRRCPLEPRAGAHSRPVRCWEYFSVDGRVKEECLRCAAYVVRAGLCFELSRLDPAHSSQRAFCGTACKDCPYYQQVNRLPVRVLLVTRDPELPAALETGCQAICALRVARDVYGASAEIGEFRPSVVVLDSTLPPEVYGALREAIAGDRRVPWVRVVAAGGGAAEEAAGGAVQVLPRGSIAQELESLLRAKNVEQFEADLSADSPSPSA